MAAEARRTPRIHMAAAMSRGEGEGLGVGAGSSTGRIQGTGEDNRRENEFSGRPDASNGHSDEGQGRLGGAAVGHQESGGEARPGGRRPYWWRQRLPRGGAGPAQPRDPPGVCGPGRALAGRGRGARPAVETGRPQLAGESGGTCLPAVLCALFRNIPTTPPLPPASSCPVGFGMRWLREMVMMFLMLVSRFGSRPCVCWRLFCGEWRMSGPSSSRGLLGCSGPCRGLPGLARASP